MKVLTSRPYIRKSYAPQREFSDNHIEVRPAPVIEEVLKRKYVALSEITENAMEFFRKLRARFSRRPLGNFIDVRV
jgi:hypothetical protein